MDWLATVKSAFADTGLKPWDLPVSLLVALFVYGIIQTRQFASALFLLASMVSGTVRRQRQKMISRRILTMVRSREIQQIELLNIKTNMIVALVILVILIGLQIFEIKIAMRHTHQIYFANSSNVLLDLLEEFGRLFKIMTALSGVYILYELFEDAAIVRAALNVRYKGPSYLLEHKRVFDPVTAALLPRSTIFLFAFLFMVFVFMVR